jgi:Flp pilus assembly protein protease CpaA
VTAGAAKVSASAEERARQWGYRAYYRALVLGGPTFLFAYAILRSSGGRGVGAMAEALFLGLLAHLAVMLVFVIAGGVLALIRAGHLGDTSPATEAERESLQSEVQKALLPHAGAAGWAGVAAWWAARWLA